MCDTTNYHRAVMAAHKVAEPIAAPGPSTEPDPAPDELSTTESGMCLNHFRRLDVDGGVEIGGDKAEEGENGDGLYYR